jgi:hypothetical protein
MASRSKIIALIFFVCGLTLHAATCDMTPAGPAQRVFAQAGTHDAWAEFKSIDDAPKLTAGEGISAQVWMEPGGMMLVRVMAPAQKYTNTTDYCYSKPGYLDRMSFRLDTEWGWYYVAEGPIVVNRFHRTTEQFFNSASNRPIVVRPEQPDDFPAMMIPTIYLKAKFLPFADLLAKRP